MALDRHSNGYGQCAYHIVLVPRYRHRVFLNPSVKKRCEELLREKSAREGYRVHELQVAPDHVHIFLGIGPNQSVSEAIRQLKCNTARQLFREYPELKMRFWSGHFWSSGKFYRSIGQVTAETVSKYIVKSGNV